MRHAEETQQLSQSFDNGKCGNAGRGWLVNCLSIMPPISCWLPSAVTRCLGGDGLDKSTVHRSSAATSETHGDASATSPADRPTFFQFRLCDSAFSLTFRVKNVPLNLGPIYGLPLIYWLRAMVPCFSPLSSLLWFDSVIVPNMFNLNANTTLRHQYMSPVLYIFGLLERVVLPICMTFI
ncbi:uncharacterized protein BDR25DRAFT_350833 [Lindgomyces ingoldianus]|uniref:Uncharacterized protein n=1 Tax=Lindgomyces ingoldianus TaxID=673940 RepID=A0ACB6RAT5_9PLEO|nr:uncharacterized protein BDR25DRAFT_350833 [Lindgomyces ingoldianus]KAF2475460.1 hypothetical protein BDR25DRAFT_350833 [Lindgomyces ingoldianus]